MILKQSHFSAYRYVELTLDTLFQLAQQDEKCVEVLRWAQEKSSLNRQPGPAARVICVCIILLHSLACTPSSLDAHANGLDAHDLFLALAIHMSALTHAISLIRTLNFDLAPALAPTVDLIRGLAVNFVLDKNRDRTRAHSLARSLAQATGISLSEKEQPPVPMKTHHLKMLSSYLEANWLLVRCLRLAVVSDRADIEARLLLPPGKSESELQGTALDRG